MLLHESTGEPYQPGELRSFYEGAFTTAFADNPNRGRAHEMFDFTFGADASSHRYLVTVRYLIPEEQSANYPMPATVSLIAENFAKGIWGGVLEAIGNDLYLSFPQAERAWRDDFETAVRSECSSEKWGFLFLEDNQNIDLVTNSKDFSIHAAPEGFMIEGTQCYPLPALPVGCALFLEEKAQFALSNPQISLEIPEATGGSYTFKSSVTLHSMHQPDTLLLVEPEHLHRVWKDRYYPSQQHLDPDLSIERIEQ